MTSLLTQVRNLARKAAKAGRGWHISKNGAIQCADKRCTLGALLFQNYAPARQIQEEYEALISRALKLEKGPIMVQATDEVFEYIPTDDKFPDPSEVAIVLDLDDELTQLVVTANDTSRKELEKNLKDAREAAEEEKDWGSVRSIKDCEDYVKAQRELKARIILEEVLCGK